jgi:Superinfection immunity protein
MTFLLLLAILYFLPTILASHRGHEITGVLLLNLFFGWTGIGWIALFLWALLSHPCYRVYPVPGAYYPPDYWRR